MTIATLVARLRFVAGIVVLVRASGVAARDEDGCLGSDAARIAAGFYPQYNSGARDGSCILITRDADTFLGCEKTCEEKANGTLVSAFNKKGRTKVGELLYLVFEKNATALESNNFHHFWIGLYENVLGDWKWVNSDEFYPKGAEGWNIGQPNGGENVIAAEPCSLEGESVFGITWSLQLPLFFVLIVTLILNVMMNRGGEREVSASGVHPAGESANRKRRVSITSAMLINADIAKERSGRRRSSGGAGAFIPDVISGVQRGDRIQTVEVPLAGLKFALISGGGESGQRTARWLFRAVVTFGICLYGIRMYSLSSLFSFIWFLSAFAFYYFYGIASRIIGDDPTHLARIVRPLVEHRESFKAFWHSKERSIQRFGKMNIIGCVLTFVAPYLLLGSYLTTGGARFQLEMISFSLNISFLIYMFITTLQTFLVLLQILSKGHNAHIKKMQARVYRLMLCSMKVEDDFDPEAVSEKLTRPEHIKAIVAELNQGDAHLTKCMRASAKLCIRGVYALMFGLLTICVGLASIAYELFQNPDISLKIFASLAVISILVLLNCFMSLLNLIAEVGDSYNVMLSEFSSRADLQIASNLVFGAPDALYQRYAPMTVKKRFTWVLFEYPVDSQLVSSIATSLGVGIGLGLFSSLISK